ncbi:MAG TPA: hypothetical protein VMN57_08035, partial [Anaerolineales bacterium]|nr:hypothetical protein [Anaerolineales bacterium]
RGEVWRGLRPPRPSDWILFSVLSAAAMYTHNLAAFYLAPLALIPFWLPSLQERFAISRRKRGQTRPGPAEFDHTPGPGKTHRPPNDSPIRPSALLRLRSGQDSPIQFTLLASAGALLLYLPWLVRLPAQLAKVSGSYWTESPGTDRLVTTLLSFTTNLPVSQVLLPFALLSAVLTFVLALWQTVRAILARRRPESLVAGLVLSYLALVPPALTFAVSQFFPVYIERALLPSGVAYLLWVAWALTETGIPRFVRTIAAVALLVGMFIGLQTHLTYAGFPYAPYAEVNAAIRTSAPPGTGFVIVHSNKLTALPAHLLDPDLPHRYLPDLPGSGADTLALPTQEVIGFFADEDVEAAAGGASRVYFIVFRKEIDEYLAAGEEGHPQLAWLDEQYTRIGSESWDDLVVYEYALP